MPTLAWLANSRALHPCDVSARQALVDAGVCPPEKAKMRASQVWGWMHHYGVTDFAAMSNVAKDMQAKLAERFTIARPVIVERQLS